MAEPGGWEKFVANAQSAASSLRVNSALNPMLWLCGIVTLPCFVLAYFFRGIEPLDSLLVYVGSAPIAATILGFFYFMVKGNFFQFFVYVYMRFNLIMKLF